ncbi:MAG: hypothetical protein MUO84_07675, partial [Thermoplasmata archaeon]|nr:hypothetical protein [Thermoplasmata archaeon]
TAAEENAVYFVAVKARYLGFAQVYNNNGEMIEEDHAIKVYTMYAVKLDSMLEFNDSDEDGVLNYTRSYDGDEFKDYTYDETVYKKVDLNVAWDASDVIETEGEDCTEWTFDLTATDLPYELVDESAQDDVGDNVLNELKLSFHMTADLAQYDDISLPQWRVTVTTGSQDQMVFKNATKLDPLQAEGKIMQYDVKWDQEITGWDYDSENANQAVLLEFHSIVGNSISPGMTTWMEMNTLTYMNEVGVMSYVSTEGDLEVNETTGDLTQVETLTQTSLYFGTDETNIGALTWAQDVTIDGETEQVKVQIMAGHMISTTAEVAGELKTFTGFIALGAMTFPGGNSIVHDPVFSSEAVMDVSTGDKENLSAFILLVMVVAIVVIVVAVAAVMIITRKKATNK